MKLLSSLNYTKALTITFTILLLTLSTKGRTDDLGEAMIKSQTLSPSRLFSRAELLFNRSTISSVKLSPDGQHLFFIIEQDNKKELWMLNNDTGVKSKRFTSAMIRGFYWASDSQRVFLHLKAGMGVLGVSPTDNPEIILKLDKEKEQYFYGLDKGSPHHFYVWIKEQSSSGNAKEYVLYRVDHKGNKESLYQNDEIVNFLAPAGGFLKFISKKENNVFKIYELRDNRLHEVYQCHFTDYCRLLNYQAKTNTLFVKGRGKSDLSQLISLDLNLDTPKVTTLHQDPENRFDIGTVTFDTHSDLPIMTSYETDYFENYGLTKEVSHHIRKITQTLKSPIIKIQPELNAKYWLISDHNPNKAQSRLYLYNTISSKLTQPLENIFTRINKHNNQLNDDDLALRIAIQYKASDGMMLQGYVTLPRGLKPEKLPLVVVPHGGPFSRRTGGDTRIAQFLANRGHAVFEPNFRGSKGFGRHYMHAANRDFGDGRVQQDIIDGLEYVLSRGIGDRSRLAINGGSFGGFSTLAALTFTPDLFQVGIAVSPGTALSKTVHYLSRDLKGHRKAETLKRLAYQMVDVNSPADVKRSDDKSPSFHAEKITKPLYIIAGEKDRKVSILNVRDYALRLESMGKKVTFLSAPNEGHIYQQKHAVEAWYYLLEKALFDHIGGRMQKDPTPKVQQFLKKNILLSPAI